MDISRSRFPFELVSIIQLIANSHFVAFDLEFSGIAGRRRDRKKPTLQEVYEDVKGAAEQYQVLQVGLTVVQEDLVAGERPTKSSTRYTTSHVSRWRPLSVPHNWNLIREPIHGIARWPA
jgi:CAF1 family ribonuclease